VGRVGIHLGVGAEGFDGEFTCGSIVVAGVVVVEGHVVSLSCLSVF